jgi:hypothetical protein
MEVPPEVEAILRFRVPSRDLSRSITAKIIVSAKDTTNHNPYLLTGIVLLPERISGSSTAPLGASRPDCSSPSSMTGVTKPITPLRQCLNKFRISRSISQRPSDLENVFSEHLRINERIRPQCVEDFVRGYYLASVLDQIRKHIEGLWSDGDSVPVTPQQMICCV